jgi:hypothetical protein
MFFSTQIIPRDPGICKSNFGQTLYIFNIGRYTIKEKYIGTYIASKIVIAASTKGGRMSEGRQKLYAYRVSSLRDIHTTNIILPHFPATDGISLWGGLSVALFGFFCAL